MSQEFFEDLETERNEEPKEAMELESGVILEHLGEQKEKLGGIAEFFENLTKKEYIAGDPEADMENWHMQESDVSCAVVCQEFIADELLDRDFTEAEFCAYAQEQGWFDPETGTSMYDVGNILESMGLDVERQTGVTLAELAQMLENGEKVIVGVNNMILSDPEMAGMEGLSANHAVQVIGIDSTDPDNIKVILNDPGVADGRGISHDLSTFMNAWSTSQNFAVSVEKE